MKRFLIPLAIAAVLGIASGVAAVNSALKASADTDYSVPEPVYGNYYLNGDVESGMYLTVTEDYISLNSDDLVADFKAEIKRDYYENYSESYSMTEEQFEQDAEVYAADYSAENPYVVSYVGFEDIPYAVLIHWNADENTPSDNIYAGSGYWYNGTDTLNLNWFGDFILVEETNEATETTDVSEVTDTEEFNAETAEI